MAEGDGDTTTTESTTTTTTTPPWYEGKADAETIGHWQNKGWKTDDPALIAIEATKAAREAQKFVGVPPEQLLRLPKEANDEAGWNGVWQRLGVPAEAKDYDFTAIKFADGTELEQGFVDTMRSALHSARVPKERAGEVAKAVVKYMEAAEAEDTAAKTAKINEEKTKLATNWGANAEINKAMATLGAKRLGISPEAVAALEGVVGYADVMEAFRKIGAGTNEDTFHEGRPGPSGAIVTVEQARARKAELMADDAWQRRYLDGGAPEKREMSALNQLIAAASSAAAA